MEDGELPILLEDSWLDRSLVNRPAMPGNLYMKDYCQVPSQASRGYKGGFSAGGFADYLYSKRVFHCFNSFYNS